MATENEHKRICQMVVKPWMQFFTFDKAFKNNPRLAGARVVFYSEGNKQKYNMHGTWGKNLTMAPSELP